MNKAKEIVTKGRLAVILIIAILLIDQFIKIWVKTHMELHESIRVTNWFYIAFIENNGMAYGMQIGSKLLLSLFRVVAIGALGYYIWLQSKKTNVRWGYIVCLSMILAGAAGNLIDFPSLSRLIPIGSLFVEVRILSSLVPYLILPTRVLVLE